jgi:hypothetical protein
VGNRWKPEGYIRKGSVEGKSQRLTLQSREETIAEKFKTKQERNDELKMKQITHSLKLRGR